jgi:hypothetical protein
MLRSFLLGLSSGDSALPFGVTSVGAVSVGSGMTVALSQTFSTVSCDPHRQKVSSSSASCECGHGYESGESGGCLECDANSYKSTVSDSDKCLACPDGSVSEAGSRVCSCSIDGYVLDEKEMLCRDANGNVYRDAFKILGIDGLYFILGASVAFLVLLFIVIYCSHGGDSSKSKGAAPAPVAAGVFGPVRRPFGPAVRGPFGPPVGWYPSYRRF